MIYSGASFHVTPHIELFTSYSRGNCDNVKMGNSGASKIVGVGDIGWRQTLEGNCHSRMLGMFHICT